MTPPQATSKKVWDRSKGLGWLTLGTLDLGERESTIMVWQLDDRGICAMLMGTGALLLGLRLRPRTAELAWLGLLLAGLINAVVLSVLPQNLVNMNLVHHYLGAKYAFPYKNFYQVVNAAVERPQVAMRDLRHPPAMFREDPRDQRAYYIDLMRAEGIAFDALATLGELRRQAEASGVIRKEAEHILQENLAAKDIENFRRDVRLALWSEKAEENIEWKGRNISWDYGFNGSPLYALFRKLDPTLHLPFSRVTAYFNLAWQIAAGLLFAWFSGKALGLATHERLAIAALLFASWDFVGWALPGLIFAGLWLPVAFLLLAMKLRRAEPAAIAIGWAGLIKLFPFVLTLPAIVRVLRRGLLQESEDKNAEVWGWSFKLLVWSSLAMMVLGAAATLSGRSWLDFLDKILVQFQLKGYIINSVSLSQGMLTLGIYGSPLQLIFPPIALLILASMFFLPGDSDFMASLPRRALVLLGAIGWLVHTWFNYYAIAPLLLLPLVAREHSIGASVAAGSMAIAFLLPEFDHPLLLAYPALHGLKLAPYLLIPAWLVELELRSLGYFQGFNRIAGIVLLLCLVATVGEALRMRAIRQLDETAGKYLDSGDARHALDRYRWLTTLAPRNAMAHMNEAIALAKLGQNQAATAGFTRAVALSPESFVTHQNYGLMLLELGRLEESGAEFETARSLKPYDESTLLYLARIRLRQGRNAEAQALLARALELRPTNLAVRGLLQEIQRP